MVMLLAAEENVVHTYAANALEKLLATKVE